jgi:ribonuclease-3
MTDRRAEAVAALQARIGHDFKDASLLERALTHASVGSGAGRIRDNERLEFLGDRVLGLLASEQLVQVDDEAQEGVLSTRLARLVSGRTCAIVARRLGVGDALRLAPGETRTGGRDKDTILGDACEALIAAIYLDGGLAAARAFFLENWKAELIDAQGHDGKDPKTRLQEWAQARGLGLPVYDVVARTGPDHAPRFTVEVRIADLTPQTAEGASRREAEKVAAEALLGRETVS